MKAPKEPQMRTQTAPAQTYFTLDTRPKVIAWANTLAERGDKLNLTFENGEVRRALVIHVETGQYVNAVAVHIFSTATERRRRAWITGDTFNNLTDFTITKIAVA